MQKRVSYGRNYGKKELILTQTSARKNKINKFAKFSLQKRKIFFTFFY